MRIRADRQAEPQGFMKMPSILLVDDFEDALQMYEEYLLYRGFNVIVARNGEEAIAQARSHRPDVILLDVRMPGMTGTEVMRILRADRSFANTLIVALTAQALDEERRRALSAGFDEVIPKPCLPDALVATVQGILSDRSLRMASRPRRSEAHDRPDFDSGARSTVEST